MIVVSVYLVVVVVLVQQVSSSTTDQIEFCDQNAMNRLRTEHQHKFYLPNSAMRYNFVQRSETIPLTGIGVTRSDIYLMLSQTLFKIPISNLRPIGNRWNRYPKPGQPIVKQDKIWYPVINEMANISSLKVYPPELEKMRSKFSIKRLYTLQDSQQNVTHIILVELDSEEEKMDYVTVIVDKTGQASKPYWHQLSESEFKDDSSFVFNFEGKDGFEVIQRKRFDRLKPDIVLSPYYITHMPGPNNYPFVEPTKQFKDSSKYNKVIRLLDGQLNNNSPGVQLLPVQFEEFIPNSKNNLLKDLPFQGFVGGFLLNDEVYLFDYMFVYCFRAKDSPEKQSYWNILLNQSSDTGKSQKEIPLTTNLIRIPWYLFFNCNRTINQTAEVDTVNDINVSDNRDEVNQIIVTTENANSDQQSWSALFVLYLIALALFVLITALMSIFQLLLIARMVVDCHKDRSKKQPTTTNQTARMKSNNKNRKFKTIISTGRSKRFVSTTSPNPSYRTSFGTPSSKRSQQVSGEGSTSASNTSTSQSSNIGEVSGGRGGGGGGSSAITFTTKPITNQSSNITSISSSTQIGGSGGGGVGGGGGSRTRSRRKPGSYHLVAFSTRPANRSKRRILYNQKTNKSIFV